jgi:hypothetical protein
MILAHTKEFFMNRKGGKEKRPNFTRFERKEISKSPDFFKWVARGSPEYERIIIFVFILYLVYGQVWLNFLLLHGHHKMCVCCFNKKIKHWSVG